MDMDKTVLILLIIAALVVGLGLLPSFNIYELNFDEDFFPLPNIINSLNSNPATFSATTCRDTTVDEEPVTHIAGKFNNGNFALDNVDIGVGLIDSDGNVMDDALITLYDLSPNETRFFDEVFYDVTGIWETCEFQVEFVTEN